MYVRPLRYNQPAALKMLDIFNFTNGTQIEPWQVSFGVPLAVPDLAPNIVPAHLNDYDLRRPNDTTLTEIVLSPTAESGWTGNQLLTYRREVIQDHFVSVPFVLYAVENTDQVILDKLLEQYGLYLDAHLVDVSFKPVDLNEVLFLNHMGSIVDGGNCDYQPPITHNAIITMKPEHPVYIGAINVYIREAVRFLDRDVKTTLEVHRYLGPGDHAKMPAEMILPNNRFVDDNFVMRGLKVNDLVGPWIVEKAKAITGDNWVFSQEHGVFNLYGAKVIYNGLNTGDVYINDPKVSNLLIIQFSDEHCSNIRGQWIIGYYNSDVWARRTRIDALPIQDQ
jgi:hypothetical protein